MCRRGLQSADRGICARAGSLCIPGAVSRIVDERAEPIPQFLSVLVEFPLVIETWVFVGGDVKVAGARGNDVRCSGQIFVVREMLPFALCGGFQPRLYPPIAIVDHEARRDRLACPEEELSAQR